MPDDTSGRPDVFADAPPARSTLDDVAALAGVSAKTASRALNQHAGVSEATRKKVADAARMLRFRPNGLAKELRTGAVSSGVGLIIADLANPFFSQIASAAESVLRRNGLELFIGSTGEDAEREREVVRTMLERRVQALLVVPASDDHSYLQFEKSLGTPIIFIDRPPVRLATDAIVSDDEQAAFRATQALVEAGHRRIAILGDDQSAWTARQRLAGAQRALEGRPHGGSADIVRVGAHDPETAERITAEVLGGDEPPTAIFALNNLITLGALKALRSSAAEVSVIGFDDSDLADMLDVSVVAIDPAEMGRTTAQLAIDRIKGRDDAPQSVLLPTRLVVRTPLDRPVRFGPQN